MKILTLLFLVFLSASAFANSDKVLVKGFAKSIIYSIANNDIETFKKLACHPSNCTDDKHTIKTVFGSEDIETSFEKVFKANDIEIKIIGPYTYESKYSNKSYTIVFFNASDSPFNKDGVVTTEIGIKELFNSFFQTVVTIKEGEAGFHRVPFHLESHHPYVGDYG